MGIQSRQAEVGFCSINLRQLDFFYFLNKSLLRLLILLFFVISSIVFLSLLVLLVLCLYINVSQLLIEIKDIMMPSLVASVIFIF